MRSPMVEHARRWIVLVALAAGALTACVIGPKQDDPSSASIADTGTGEFDSGAGGGDDSALEDNETGKLTDATSGADSLAPSPDTAAADTAAPKDASCGDADGGSDACGDAPSSDAVSDAESDASSDVMDGG